MKLQLQKVLPQEIEARSMEIITAEWIAMAGEDGWKRFAPEEIPVVQRCIHTSADFDYATNLSFSPQAVQIGIDALKKGALLITDTTMALSGISKMALAKLGATAVCYIADPEVAAAAKEHGTTRAVAAVEKAASLQQSPQYDGKPLIFVVGNAPTALARIGELVQEGKLHPALVIGVPVGFVNVVESKEFLCALPDQPYIVARGRKGGSNIAAAICNALLYEAGGR